MRNCERRDGHRRSYRLETIIRLQIIRIRRLEVYYVNTYTHHNSVYIIIIQYLILYKIGYLHDVVRHICARFLFQSLDNNNIIVQG